VNTSGAFQFPNFPAGIYGIFSIVGLPPDAYVSSIALGETALPVSGEFRISGGTAQNMQIRIASPGGPIPLPETKIPGCFPITKNARGP